MIGVALAFVVALLIMPWPDHSGGPEPSVEEEVEWNDPEPEEAQEAPVPITPYAPKVLVTSPLDKLDPDRIPVELRRPYEPAGLVAAFGNPYYVPAASRLRSVAISPDGKWVVCGRFDGCVRVLEAETLRPAATLNEKNPADDETKGNNPVECLAFAQDGKTLASLEGDGTLCLYEVEGKKVTLKLTMSHTPGKVTLKRTRRHPKPGTPVGPAPTLQLSSDGEVLVVGHVNRLQIWDLSGLLPRPRFTMQPDADRAVLAPDGHTLATCHGETVWVWNLDANRRPLFSNAPFWRPSGKWTHGSFSWEFLAALVCGAAGILLVWYLRRFRADLESINDATWRRRMRHLRIATALAFAGVVPLLAVAVLDVPWAARGFPVDGPVPLGSATAGSVVNALAFSPAGGLLATGQQSGTVRLYKVGADCVRDQGSFEGHLAGVKAVAFSGDGLLLASGSEDGTIRLWEVADKLRERASFRAHNGGVTSLAWTPDGTGLVSAGDDGAARLWDVRDDSPRQRIAQIPPIRPEQSGDSVVSETPNTAGGLLFLGDGKTLADTYTKSGVIRFWDLSGPVPVEKAHLECDVGSKNVIASSPDGRLFAAVDKKKEGRLWDVGVQPPKELAHFPSVADLHFNPNGRMLATAYKTHDWVWDVGVNPPKELARFSDVTGFEFGPDGKTVAVVRKSGGVRLLELEGETLRERGNLPEHKEPYGSLGFSPDGRYLVTKEELSPPSSSKRGLRIWDVSVKPPVERHIVDEEAGEILFPVFPPHGNTLVVYRFPFLLRSGRIHSEASLDVYDLSGPAPVHKGSLNKLGSYVEDFRLTADGRTVSVWLQGGKSVKRWDLSATPPQPIEPGEARDEAEPVVLMADNLSVWTVEGKKLWEWSPEWEVEGSRSLKSRRVSLALDRRHFAVANADGTVFIVRLYGPDAFDRQLERDPCSVPALLGRGRARVAKGSFDDAIKDADCVLAIDGMNADAKALRAKALYQRGLRRADEVDYAGAKADIAEALRLDPALAPPPARKPRRRQRRAR
jgi:WD40 repeat protein